MHKLIIANGPDVNPLWVGRIAISKDYTGKNTLNLASALAAGGSLIVGDTYYYKVVAMVSSGIVLSGDAANQLSLLSLSGPLPGKLYWRLTNSGTTRKVDIARDPNFLELVCSGSRTGDGAIVLSERNFSLITGGVTVTYSAQDADSGNTIAVAYNYVEGNDEVSETIVGGTQSIDLTWDALVGNVSAYRIYRGTASGVYDGFFISATNSFSDDGTVMLSADEVWMKSDIRKVSGVFIPDGQTTGLDHPARCILHVEFMTTDRYIDLDLTSVSNHATWSAGTLASVTIADNEFNSWL